MSLLPNDMGDAVQQPVHRPPATASGEALPPHPCCPNGFIYTVQAGDTLFNIARRFSVSLDALIAANPQIADPNLIMPGQQVCVPVQPPARPPEPSPPSPPPPPSCLGGFIYTVQPGDTMAGIADKFDVPEVMLMRANPQITDPAKIVPGQQICIPVPPVPPVPMPKL